MESRELLLAEFLDSAQALRFCRDALRAVFPRQPQLDVIVKGSRDIHLIREHRLELVKVGTELENFLLAEPEQLFELADFLILDLEQFVDLLDAAHGDDHGLRVGVGADTRRTVFFVFS